MSIGETKNEAPMDLWDFSIISSNGAWQPVPHLNLIIEFLHFALNGQLENFACALSPRLGKSMEVSEIFPAYVLGSRPYAKIIHVSYNDSLASGFGSKAKDNLDEFGHLFPEKPKLSQDTKAKHWFKVANNTGEYFCSGASGSILGRGANVIIVDDPSKNVEEARSPRIQEKMIDLFDTTISTRKEKDPFTGQNAITIILQQRLDKNDLIGIILKKREWISAEEALPRLRRGEKLGHVWVYLRLPELAEENDILGREIGEPLWPEKRGKKELLQIKKDIGSYKFNAIHQQDPQDREGTIFKREWFYDENNDLHDYLFTNKLHLPESLNEIRNWDFAASGDEGDATAGLRNGFYDDKLVFRHLVHGKYTAQQVLSTYKNTTLNDGRDIPSIIEQEPGSGSKLLIQRFKSEPEFKWFKITRDKVTASKLDRAFDLEVMAETQCIQFDTDMMSKEDIEKCIIELINFTGEDGGEDNITDTMTAAARYWKRKRKAKVYMRR
jgi:phage terminase large subunit-like protein